jgi:hypothetical protein
MTCMQFKTRRDSPNVELPTSLIRKDDTGGTEDIGANMHLTPGMSKVVSE